MSHPIRILHVYKAALPTSMGGVEVFLDILCQTTAKIGIQNKILSLAKYPKITPIDRPGYQVIEAKQNFFFASTGFSFEAFKKFKALTKLKFWQVCTKRILFYRKISKQSFLLIT